MKLALEDPDAFFAHLERFESGSDLPPNRVRQTQFWLFRGDRMIGASRLRHRLIPFLERDGGHIAYEIRPSERRKGFGSEILRLTLREAAALGIRRALLTTEPSNLGSIGVILNNGGRFEDTSVSPETGRQLNRYWIEIQARAGSRAAETRDPVSLPAELSRYVGSTRELEDAYTTRGEDYLAMAIGRALGLERSGVNLETIEPGGRSSMPHAHSHEEEFVLVLAGTPTLWLDGHVRRLDPGDCVALPAGTGIAHTFLNESAAPIRLLIVGIHDPEDRVFYPLDPERVHPRPWTDPPKRRLGPHDGRVRRPTASAR